MIEYDWNYEDGKKGIAVPVLLAVAACVAAARRARRTTDMNVPIKDVNVQPKATVAQIDSPRLN